MRPRPPNRGSDAGDAEPTPKPPALAARPASRQVHLDVRPDLREGREPFKRIIGVVQSLGQDQVLILRAPFEPTPLYAALGRRGFAHWAERHAPDDWSVWFYREGEAGGGAPPSARREPGARSVSARTVVRLDVRGLEPPLPMVRVLEGLESLGPDEVLEVVHDRRPMFLYPQIEDRGFTHATDESLPGVVRILIQRKDAES